MIYMFVLNRGAPIISR